MERVRVPVRHDGGFFACGGIAFIAKRRFEPGDFPKAEDFETPSGRPLKNGEPLCCDACGEPIFPGQMEGMLFRAGAFVYAFAPGEGVG